MKAIILAGGLGTRLSEETHLRPKPMVDVGGKPILWHVMKIYAAHGVNDFIICAGYKAYVIKEYFANYLLHQSDITFDLGKNSVEIHQRRSESWRVTIVDTGDATMTGGRLKRVREYIGNETFFFTYGDGVGNVDIRQLLDFHRSCGRLATVTGVQPAGRYGALEVDGTRVVQFHEKPEVDGAWINGGFFALEPSVIDLVRDDSEIWERRPLEQLAARGELSVYKHAGFWQPMDTLREKKYLDDLWSSGGAPWKIW